MEQGRVEPFGTGFQSPGQGWGSKGQGLGGTTVRVITRGPMEAFFPLFLLASLLCPSP